MTQTEPYIIMWISSSNKGVSALRRLVQYRKGVKGNVAGNIRKPNPGSVQALSKPYFPWLW